MNDQEFKQTEGKLSFKNVLLDECVDGVAQVREWAIENKYPSPEGWKKVPEKDLIDAVFRHYKELKKYGIKHLDDESGFPTIWHLQTNLSFLEFKRKAEPLEYNPLQGVVSKTGKTIKLCPAKNIV